MSFVHLHVHSEYSIVDGIVQIDPLCETVKQHKMPAIALTDVCNLFGMVKFYKEAMQNGIQPIVGAELWLEPEESHDKAQKLLLLCQNLQGYHQLTTLISRAYQEGVRDSVPLLKKQWLSGNSDGLIAISGAQYGDIGHALINNETLQKAELLLAEWMTLFPNRFYLSLQRNHRQQEREHERKLLQLTQKIPCPIVATNEVVFLSKDDFSAHEARVCIQEGTTLEQAVSRSRYSPEQYLKSPQEMQALFKDLPVTIKNTVEIAKRCAFSLTLEQSVLPSFPVPAQMTESTFLAQTSQEGLAKRLLELKIPDSSIGEYQQRLEREIGVICSMGFAGYFLIVADFIQWAKTNSIPVGPGRGSGAGSLVAYALGITDLDPIGYELLFERFLNPERVSMPDFDIDFCMDGRDRVIEYVASRYGRQNVSQIATFGTMAAKAVIRDVGRVLGFPYGFVDKIAKLVPFEIGITLEKALQEPAFQERYQQEEDVKTLVDLAKKLEGITRNVGKHAGGVVIAPSKLTDFAPFYCEKDSPQVVIQFDKDDVEAIGLVKFDFLGLRTLTIIDKAIANANQLIQHDAAIDIQQISLQDDKTFALLKNCLTTAVFQLESRGMKELIKRLQPDNLEEIIALVALFRPGPLQSGMVDDFINRKMGRAVVEYPHPAIEPILKPTYGVILYQEQVMQIAQTLAGYTLGGADLLRRAMGKKKPEEMAKQRAIFVEGSVARGVEEKTATYIFDLMEKFAGYGFNKSHSAAYALVSYQTAWLKAHFPSAFMAAVLSADMSQTDKVVDLIEECKNCQIPIISPDIRISEYAFKINDKNEIIYGLGAIKGAGEAAIQHLIAIRQERPFKDLFDLCSRADVKKLNKRVLESLIKAGAMDCFGQERAYLMAILDEAIQLSNQQAKNISFGQSDMFADLSLNPQPKLAISVVKPWSVQQRLEAEKESLGLYFSGHPLVAVELELGKIGVVKYRDLTRIKKDQKILVAGLVISLKTLLTKNGDRMAIVTLDDRLNRFEVTVFSEAFQTYRELLVKDQLLIVQGFAGHDQVSGATKVRAQILYSLSSAREVFAKQMHIRLSEEKLTQALIDALKICLLKQDRGSCPVVIQYQSQAANSLIKLDQEWNIKPTDENITQISQITESEVILEYA